MDFTQPPETLITPNPMTASNNDPNAQSFQQDSPPIKTELDGPVNIEILNNEEGKSHKREAYWYMVQPDVDAAPDPQELSMGSFEVDTLVPIRIDVEIDGCRLVDSFLWNLKETETSPEQFASILCSDLGLAPKFEQEIASAIRRQLALFSRPSLRNLKEKGEFLVPITIDLRFKALHLKDRFEWDLFNEATTPELFAQIMCADLDLPGEFELPIAMHIREQLLDYRALLAGKEVQPLDSTMAEYSGKRRRLNVRRMPAVNKNNAVRSQEELDHWAPVVSLVAPAEQLQLLEVLWQRHCPDPADHQKGNYHNVVHEISDPEKVY